MIKIGTILLIESELEKYMVIERLEDFANGEGGWLCANLNELAKDGSDKISPLDCWRVNDKYLEMQLKIGNIKIVEQNED